MNPMDWFNEWLASVQGEFGKVALDWLREFVISPTDLHQYPYVNQVYDWVYALAFTIGECFIIANLFLLYVKQMHGTDERTPKQVMIKGITAMVLAFGMPYLVDLLLKVNNAWIEFVVKQGIQGFQTFETLFQVDASLAGAAIILAALVLVALMIILGIQYFIRLGLIIVLLITSPVAAMTMINEDINIMPAWWREVIATIFMQSFQVPMLYIILNMLSDGKNLKDYLMACGFVVVLIKSPSFLRQILYSTGAGRGVIQAAGGMGRFAIYKYAAKKVIRR